jgi:hypothetical protein
MFDASKQKKTFFLFLVVGCWLVGCQGSDGPPLQGGFPRYPEGQGGDLDYQDIQEDPNYGWLYFDATPSATPSNTPSPSVTPSNTPSPSVTPPNTPSSSDTPPNTPSSSDTPSATPTQTPASTQTGTSTPAGTPSETSSASASPSDTPLSCSWVYNSNNNFPLGFTPSSPNFLLGNNLVMTSDGGSPDFNVYFYPNFPGTAGSFNNIMDILTYESSAQNLLSSFNPAGTLGDYDQIVTIESNQLGMAAYSYDSSPGSGTNFLYNCIGIEDCTLYGVPPATFSNTIMSGDTDANGHYWFVENSSGIYNLLVYFFSSTDQVYFTPAITVTLPSSAAFPPLSSAPTIVRIDKTNSLLYYTIGTAIYQVAISNCAGSTGPCQAASPISLTIPGTTSLANILFDDQYDLLVLDAATPPATYYVKASDMTTYTNIPFSTTQGTFPLPTLTSSQLVDLGGIVDRLQPINVSPSPTPTALDPTYLFLYDSSGGNNIYYYQYSCQ